MNLNKNVKNCFIHLNWRLTENKSSTLMLSLVDFCKFFCYVHILHIFHTCFHFWVPRVLYIFSFWVFQLELFLVEVAQLCSSLHLVWSMYLCLEVDIPFLHILLTFFLWCSTVNSMCKALGLVLSELLMHAHMEVG